MKIIDVETYVLLADNYDPSLTSSAQDTCLVIIKTDEGIEGYGDSLAPILLKLIYFGKKFMLVQQ